MALEWPTKVLNMTRYFGLTLNGSLVFKHLEADGQQQKKTTPGVSYEQETVTTIHMNSPALNKRRLQKHCVV